MTIQLIEGFDWLPVDQDCTVQLNARGFFGGTGNYIPRNTNSAFGYGNYLQTNNNFGTLFKPMKTRVTSGYVVMGMRVYIITPDYDAAAKLGFYDAMTSNSGSQCYVEFDRGGSLTFRDTLNGIIVRTDSNTFLSEKWFYLEIKVKPGTGTSGSFEVRVNTVPVISVPACNTVGGTLVGTSTHGLSGLWWDNSNISHMSIDDLYILDSTGAHNNDYLGNVRVKAQSPVSNDSVAWSIGGSNPAATNWQSVLNNALNETKFVYSPTVGAKDFYNVDPNINSPFVYAVEVAGAFRQDDATQRTARNNIKIGSTTYNGVAYDLNQTYSFYSDFYELNPATGLSFTGSELNALKIGPEVVS